MITTIMTTTITTKMTTTATTTTRSNQDHDLISQQFRFKGGQGTHLGDMSPPAADVSQLGLPLGDSPCLGPEGELSQEVQMTLSRGSQCSA
jgi:hypothetical protein